MPNRPSIPAEIVRQILIESGHRCAVCGAGCPLERAHIVSWHKSKEHRVEDLICLCANCHERADQEKWGERTLREYKRRPWILRQNERAEVNEPRGRNVTTGGNVRNSVIIAGDSNTVAIEQEGVRDRDNRLRAFRAYVFSLRGSFDDIQDHELVAAHVKSRSELRTEAAKIREDIPSDKWADFDRTVSDYCNIGSEDIECRDRTQKRPGLLDSSGNYAPGRALSWVPPARYQLGRMRIKELLNKIIEYAE
jgi:hypothetical protein